MIVLRSWIWLRYALKLTQGGGTLLLAVTWFQDRSRYRRRLGHRPDRRGAIEVGVGSRQRRAARADHHLDVEDLLHAGDELEVGDQPARGQIHNSDSALQIGPSFGDRHAAERRRLADFGEAHKRKAV